MSPKLSAAASGLVQRLPQRISSVRRFHPTVAVPSRAVDEDRADFEVTVIRARRRLVLAGEFDMAAVERFTGAAASLTASVRGGDVTVDLAALRFIDAAGLGALVRLHNTLARSEQTLRIRRPSPRITRVFEAGGLRALLPPVGVVSDAARQHVS